MKDKRHVIYKTVAELQSNHDRVDWAENLIRQLPEDHEGRNSWLLNYGTSEEAKTLRATRGVAFVHITQAAETTNSKARL